MTTFIQQLGTLRSVAERSLDQRRRQEPRLRKDPYNELGRGSLRVADAIDYAICGRHDEAVLALRQAFDRFSMAGESEDSLSRQTYLRAEGQNPAETLSQAVALLRLVVFSSIAAEDELLLAAYERAWIAPAHPTPFCESTTKSRAFTRAAMHSSRAEIARARDSLVPYFAAIDSNEDGHLLPMDAGILAIIDGDERRLQVALDDLWQERVSSVLSDPFSAFDYQQGSVLGEQSRSLTRIAERLGMEVSIPTEQVDFGWPGHFDALQQARSAGTGNSRSS